MANKQQKGNCYLCGASYTRSGMLKHLQTHLAAEEGQPSYLLKVRDEDNKYWLYLDLSMTSTLSALDTFLRNIWLECCGHLSAFLTGNRGYNELSMSTKLSRIPEGTELRYMYDFGSTTCLFITFVQIGQRTKQRLSVRLLARNAPYTFPCSACGRDAAFYDMEEWPPVLYCADCMKKTGSDYPLPVTNSPRSGVCAYAGERDSYAFDPRKVVKKT